MSGRRCSPPPATAASLPFPASQPFPAILALLAVLVALALGLPAGAQAQERAGSVYVSAGVTAVRQSGAADGDSQVYIAAPGGTTTGWSVAGGVFAARRASIEVEWSSSGTFRAREPSRYGMTYTEERRDRSLGLMIRLHVSPGRRVDIEPLAGVGAIWHDRWSQTETYRSYLPADEALTIGPRTRFPTLRSATLLGGLDVRIGGRRYAVVPSLRLRTWKRSDDIVAYYPAGSPNWALAAGVSARVGF